MSRNATSRRHSELLTLGVGAKPQGERFALVIRGALAVWNVGIAFVVGSAISPAGPSCVYLIRVLLALGDCSQLLVDHMS
jgi:hypothetical protein